MTHNEEMILVKRLEEKEKIINNLHSSIHSLEKEIDNYRKDNQELRENMDNAIVELDKVKNEEFINESFLKMTGLQTVFDFFRRKFVDNDYTIDVHDLKEMCNNAILEVRMMFEILSKRIDFLNENNIENKEQQLSEEENYMTDLQMFTQEEVAEMLHANVNTITTLREIGILPAIRTGRNYMISKGAILDFQKNYAGLDVSNRVKALDAYRLVKNRMEA